MKRPHLNLNLTSVIVILAVGVMIPVMLSTVAGIIAIVIADNSGGIVIGVLIISFAVTASGFGLVAVVMTSRKARLARRQADFIAGVTHELRTPLSAIRLYAQTLESGKLADNPEYSQEYIKTILRETEWLDVMIEKVLSWRASSRDMMRLDFQIKSVKESVKIAVERFKRMVPPDEVSFSCSVNSSLPVRHDVTALSSVILNLLTNSYKYTDKNKIIKIDVQDTREKEDAVLIKIRDNGIGLSSQEIKKIFNPFYRAGNGLDSNPESGTGLGLTIARHLIHQHNGIITVSSKKGHGALFTIRLPSEGPRS